MSLQHMWAEWRLTYVSEVIGDLGKSGDERCVLCAVVSVDDPEVSHVVHRAEFSSVVLNRFPYTNGHVLVLPHRHVAKLEDLYPEESLEFWELLQKITKVITHSYEPGGINLGANLGAAAGAGIPDHLHFHVLPRWRGDTNFMTAIADTRVMPESLPRSAQRLREAWSVVHGT